MHPTVIPGMTYPLFLPPAALATKGAKQWSADEARQYFSWFQTIWENRVEAFLAHVSLESGPYESRNLLEAADKMVLRELMDGEFVTHQGVARSLTNAGRALAADFGLLFARSLISNSKQIHWEMVTSPRTDVSFNLPVLMGFGRVHLDPIRSATAHYAWLLEGRAPKNTWWEAYEFWLARVRS